MSKQARGRASVFLAVTAAALLTALGQAGAQSTSASGALPAETVQPDLVKLLPPRVADAKTLTVAVSLGSPPDDFRNDRGEIAGWEIDILRAATEAMGLQLDIRPTTFDTLIPGLQARRFDAAVGQIGVTEVREKVVDMIGTLLGNELFAALTGSDIKVNGLDDLCGLTVATTRGSREYEFAQLQNPKCEAAGKKPINMLAFNDGNSAAESLMSKRSDLFWVGSTAVSYFVAQSQGKTKVVGSYTDLSYIGVALQKGSDMSAPLQAAIQHLIDDGTYRKIVEKWGLENGAIKQAALNPTGTPR
ncbi:MAG: ABC transporter substrate-binding protein [Acidisphaera sp.]|nr:ABC transporter substrate-binding protein [Acidisphaera sp.]